MLTQVPVGYVPQQGEMLCKVTKPADIPKWVWKKNTPAPQDKISIRLSMKMKVEAGLKEFRTTFEHGSGI